VREHNIAPKNIKAKEIKDKKPEQRAMF